MLRALFRRHEGPHWFNAIARGSKSVSGVRRELDRLLRLGVIRDRRAAGGRFFEIVATHPLAAVLTDLVDATEQTDACLGDMASIELMLGMDPLRRVSADHWR